MTETMADRLFRELDAATKRGDLEARIRVIRQLLSLVQQSENKLGEVEALRMLGNAFQDKGQLQKAHAYRVTAARLMEELGEDCPLEVQMMVEGDVGRSYIEVRDWEKANEFTRRALEKAESLGHEEGQCIYKINLGMVLANMGQSEQARRLAQEVLQVASRLGNHYIQALQHANLARLLLNAVQLNESQRHARKALAHAELSGSTGLQARAQEILGESYRYAQMLTGRAEYSADAERHLLEALERARSQENRFAEAQIEVTLAQLDEGRGRFAEAGAHYQRSLEALELVRGSLGYEEFQSSYFHYFQSTYDLVTQFLLRQGQLDGAFQTAERVRSRLLLATLGQKCSNTRAWPENQRDVLNQSLDGYGRAVMRQYLGGRVRGGRRDITVGLRAIDGEGSSDIGAVSEARRKLLRLYESQRLHSANWQAWQSPPIAEFQQAQQSLDADDALLAYTITEESLVIFAATRTARHFQHLNYPLKRIETDIEGLCDEMSLLQSYVLGELSSEELASRAAGDAWPKVIEDQLERLHRCLEKLFAILIAPVLPVILGKKHCIIIPHGPLHRVPWAALRGAGSYLVERHSISLLPSASLGIALKSRAASESGEAIFFGNPDGEHEDLQLPGAEREVEAAFQVLNAGPPPFTGALATKSVLLEQAPHARLLHLACHHFFDASAPLFSFLKLAGERGSQFVYAFEVAELRLSSELVTLSACESGRSRIGTGDEQYGIVRAFLAAGARSVVSTLWNIEDDSAAALFTDFYSTANRLGLAEALAATQRRMLKSPSYSLPNFWAPYVLSGEWNKPLAFPRNN